MPEHDLKKAKAFFDATSAGPWSDAGLGAMTLLKRSKKLKDLLATIFDSRIAELTAMNGDELADGMNLHPRFQGPTKETFIEA
jgi:hypothetical protein